MPARMWSRALIVAAIVAWPLFSSGDPATTQLWSDLAPLEARPGVLSTQERRQLLARAIAAAGKVLEQADDPEALVRLASIIIRKGIAPEANTLEYWVPSAEAQGRLTEQVEISIRLLDEAAALARKQAKELGESLSKADDPRAARWEALSGLAENAVFTRQMLGYEQALARAEQSPERKQLADTAIAALAAYDNAESGVQPAVRLRLGKLRMIGGQLDAAQGILAGIVDGRELSPRPEIAQQYEARYFDALCELLGGRTELARSRLEHLERWREENLPKDSATREGAAAAEAILRFRIERAMGREDEARAVLRELLKRRGDLRPVVLEQVLAQLPSLADLPKLDELALEAVVQRGESDEKARPLAIEAARELLRRGDAEARERATLALAAMLEKQGQAQPAGEAYLDYLSAFGDGGPRSQAALDAALRLLRGAGGEAYGRALALAVAPPYSRRDLFVEQGRELLSRGRYDEAIAAFDRVSPQDPMALEARYEQLLATRRLISVVTGDERQRTLDAFRRRAEALRPLASAAGERGRGVHARAMLLDADVARVEGQEPGDALKTLNGFERVSGGVEGERELISAALYTRVQCYVALGDTRRATDELVKLLSMPGGSGASAVEGVMSRLDEQLRSARRAGDSAAVLASAGNRAKLCAALAEWAGKNAGDLAWRYQLAAAEAQRVLASVTGDPAGLGKALEAYAAVEPKADASGRVQVELGQGLIAFDLGNFAEAQKRLGPLLVERKLGEQTAENDTYWEATLKLLKSNLEIARKTGDSALRQRSEAYLRELYVRWGKDVGGTAWGAEFEALRRGG